METRNDFERELAHLKRMLQNLPTQEMGQQIHKKVDSAARQFAKGFQAQTGQQSNPNRTATGYRVPPNRQNTAYQQPPHRQPAPPQYRPNPQPVTYVPTWLNKQGKIPGKTASVLLRTFGLIGAIPAVPTAILGTAIALLGNGSMEFAAAFAGTAGPIAVFFTLMTAAGFGLARSVKRCKQYRQLFANNKLMTFEQLSQITQRNKRFLLKDVKKFIRNGGLSEVYIDAQQTCLMFDEETYRQYLQLENRRKNLESTQTEATRINDKAEQSLSGVRAEGQKYIRQIRAANDALPGQEISDKLFRLEAITVKIYEYIDKHPEKLDQIDKFMDYYMPTTTKLVNAYQEFEAQPVQGENILGAKREIEEMLDTVCVAFENVLDGLFADNAMDISSDISVMETMFRQDGLTKDDISGSSTSK